MLARLVVLLAASADKMAGSWEVQNGALGFLPAWLLLAAPGGVLGAWLSHPATRTRTRWAVGGTYGALLGWGISGGRHVSTLPAQLGLTCAVAVVAGLGAAVVGRLIRMFLRERAGQWILGGALTAGCFLAELANQLILVRLYPAFHAGLSFLSVAAAGAALPLFVLGADQALSSSTKRWGGAASFASGLLLLSAVSVIPASKHVRGFDNFRWVIAEHSPTLSWGLDLASFLAPPPPIDPESATAPLGSLQRGNGVDFRGRSILLVTVDALRADHVGAYGYQRPTTPHLDRLAGSGVRFERAYAPTPHTSYSVTSLMTGKYMRPLLLQEAGYDSDLWAQLMATYGYRTAGFYPPAVFFIDTERFQTFKKRHLGFEYFKVEFAEGEKRIRQIGDYLERQPAAQPVFVWLHLFGPHEPYEDQPSVDFGSRDLDRYDEEIVTADRTIGRVVELFRARDPQAVTIVTSDHGEEFGDHGGRYHGTTVYEEQVRVPLVIEGEGLPGARVIEQPVQTIDLLPTVLGGLKIPVPPRLRGRDLSPLLSDEWEEKPQDKGFAFSETEDYTLLAQGHFRLICQRRTGACQLYDLRTDPGQKKDVSGQHPQRLQKMRQKARTLSASHGRLEKSGLRAEGKGWPAPIVRGLSGAADAAPELARLLEDANTDIRAKSAEVLFGLATEAQAPALRLALSREEDPRVRNYLALTLTRLGQGAPLTRELLSQKDRRLRRLAAVALAHNGDDAGEDVLINWWLAPEHTFEDDKMVLEALGSIRSEQAVGPLVRRLDDVRLRPLIAKTLARIGDEDAVPFLTKALRKERYQSVRPVLARSILELGGSEELIAPLRHFLGLPDPMPQGLALALEAGILEEVGGPSKSELRRLRELSDSGVSVSTIVPPVPKGRRAGGVQLLLRARATGDGRRVLIAPSAPRIHNKDEGPRYRNQPEIVSSKSLEVFLEPDKGWQQERVILPKEFGAQPGHRLGLALFTESGVELSAVAAVPLQKEIPPPPPQPWRESSQ